MNERKFRWRGLVAPKSDEGKTSRLLFSFARWQTTFKPKHRIFQLQDELLALQFFAVGKMLKILGQLIHCPLDFTHFFTQMRDLAAQFNRVPSEEQSAPDQFKELLPHGEEFPKSGSWCGGKKHGDVRF